MRAISNGFTEVEAAASCQQPLHLVMRAITADEKLKAQFTASREKGRESRERKRPNW